MRTLYSLEEKVNGKIVNDALTNDEYMPVYDEDVTIGEMTKWPQGRKRPIAYVTGLSKCRKAKKILRFPNWALGRVRSGQRWQKKWEASRWRWNGNGGDKSGTPRGFERAVIRYPFFCKKNVGCGSGLAAVFSACTLPPPRSLPTLPPWFFFSFLSTRLSPSFYVVVTFADPFYQYRYTLNGPDFAVIKWWNKSRCLNDATFRVLWRKDCVSNIFYPKHFH